MAIKTGVVVQSNFEVFRSGNIVYGSCIGGNYTVDSNNNVLYDGDPVVVPSGYRPNKTAQIYETNKVCRLTVSSDGSVKSPTGVGGNFRFSACWITEDAYPT